MEELDGLEAVGGNEEKERLDLLLSAALDDELDASEREELGRRLAAEPEAVHRGASLAAVDERLREAASGSPTLSEDQLESGLAALQHRLESQRAEGVKPTAPRDALAEPRRPGRSWLPPILLATAAALALYLAVPGTDRFEGAVEDESVLLSQALGIEDEPPLAEDLEVIEKLDLMEFLAARASGSHG